MGDWLAGHFSLSSHDRSPPSGQENEQDQQSESTTPQPGQGRQRGEGFQQKGKPQQADQRAGIGQGVEPENTGRSHSRLHRPTLQQGAVGCQREEGQSGSRE